MFLLDTDTAIYLLNGRYPETAAHLRELSPRRVGTTAITAAELRFGALSSGRPEANLERAERFLEPMTIFPFDDAAAVRFAEIKSDLSRRGELIGTVDMLIAATALAVAGILVTRNVREFSRVRSLRFENWVTSA